MRIAKRVEVSWLVPGSGPLKEQYNLDNEEDLFCWSANERLTAAFQTGLSEIEFDEVTAEEFKNITASRAMLSDRVSKRISNQRKSI